MLVSLRRWPASSPVTTFVGIVRGPALLWCVALGLYLANEVALDLSLLPVRWHARIGILLDIIVVLPATVVLPSIAAHAAARVSERTAVGGGVTGLVQTVARVTVLVVGVLVMLSTLGMQIAPLLTALGVGGLAVALAMQDTLANVFAGVHLLADKPIRIGDYVKLGDGAEGFVIDIGWRATRIRTLSNTIEVTPNQTVAKTMITNYSLPDPRLSLGLTVKVGLTADPDGVEAILRDEVARAVSSIPGLLKEPAPGVSFTPGFGESSLDFTIGYSVERFVDQYAVQNELRRRILRRFRREHVPLAIPTRAIRVEGDGWMEALHATREHQSPHC